MKIAFYGSSLLSSYWNGAATYYRGLIRALAARGYGVTFYEPRAYGRHERQDIAPPEWCRSVIFPATAEGVRDATACAAEADVVVKASGVGVFDDEILEGAMASARAHALRLWWDVDAPATLARLASGEEPRLRALIPALDAVATYGGGPPVVAAYRRLGAAVCRPIYNALDAETHHPVPRDPRFEADLAFLGNRLPDREARVDAFFFEAARLAPARRFLIGGAGWEDADLPQNVSPLGHVATGDHNAFNATPLAVLNINRESMARCGFSPPTRIFEAAGAGACILTDDWPGIETFLSPGEEVLVVRDGRDVVRCLDALDIEQAARIGERAKSRVLRDHTYDRRAAETDALFQDLRARRQAGEAA